MRPILIALALVAVAGPARANPLDAFGFGARGPAMANAVAAATEDASANYYNPAGLVRGNNLHIDVAYRAAVPHLQINGRDLGVDDSRGISVGLAAPGRLGPIRFAFGASLWLPDQRLTRVRSISFDQPRFVYYDNRQQRLVLSANLAVQIVRGLYVGAGFTFMSRTTGTVYLKGNIAVGNPDESALVTNIDVDLVAIRYPQAGLLWEIRRGLDRGGLSPLVPPAQRSGLPHRRHRRQRRHRPDHRERLLRGEDLDQRPLPAVADHRRRRGAAAAAAARDLRPHLRALERIPHPGLDAGIIA